MGYFGAAILAVVLAFLPSPLNALPQSCDIECDWDVCCTTPCYNVNDGIVTTCGAGWPCRNCETTCDDICKKTTACNTPCKLAGTNVTCQTSGYPCTEKNTERTYLFTFKVLTLNTWLMPGFCTAPGCLREAPDRIGRGEVIGLYLNWVYDYDIVLLQEAFDGYPTLGLFCAAGAGGVCKEWCQDSWFRKFYGTLCDIPGIQDFVRFPWHYRFLPEEHGVDFSGGLAVLSKFPISFEYDEHWFDCNGFLSHANDCFAQKGFLHLRLKHPSMSSPLEFFGLHLDADARDWETRILQREQLQRHMDRYPNSTFVIGGDFNTVGRPCSGEACHDVFEYDFLRPTFGYDFLDAWHEYVQGDPTQYGFTADETRNTNKHGSRQERIDYLWYSSDRNCYELELVETHVNEFLCQPPDNCAGKHLSDHFGLGATFNVWKKAGTNDCLPPDPDLGRNVGMPPRFDPIPSEFTVYIGETLNLDLQAIEDEGDRTEIFVSGLPAGATFTSQPNFSIIKANLTWTPAPNQVGSYAVVFTARDWHGARATAATTIRVSPCRAQVKLARPNPPGPYSGGEEVTLKVEEACGDSLQLSWQFNAWSGAGYTILSGCKNGALNDGDATTCVIRLSGGNISAGKTFGTKVVPLAPEKSVDVILQGRDAMGNIDQDIVSLHFSQSGCASARCEE
jgi:endonuclease/exonuclease/phosphatase family metal-dependent hydrolase